MTPNKETMMQIAQTMMNQLAEQGMPIIGGIGFCIDENNESTEYKETMIAVFQKEYHTTDEEDYIKHCSDTEVELKLEEEELTQTACGYELGEFIEILNDNPTAFANCFFRAYES